MKKWTELVLAWFVGGFIGRLVAVGITNWLGLSSIWAWLGVPIGAGFAWMAVDFRQLVFSFRHSLKWLEYQPLSDGYIKKTLPACLETLVLDWNEFSSKQMKWRIISSFSSGLFWGFWFVLCLGLGFIFATTPAKPNIPTPLAYFMGFSYVGAFAILCGAYCEEFLKKVHLNGFLKFKSSHSDSEEKAHAYESFVFFITYNPISMMLMTTLICLYTWPIWFGRVVWKTIKMVNSSQRIMALTGAAIGLTISQIWGLNPVVCGGVCVIAGLVEHVIFGFVIGIVEAHQAKKVIS